ncbi:MAG: hypothetical protein A2X40_06875 [Elusimicrobia bacterium GWC2_65_9]|nr:MAG: hypothetical protein A2X37_09190 [Elusimicrobia bacterium GWA2_66_18]OGR75262.1 MAG: hypothetical protein A2X40_06875 [Elusimicrobia bacterium GWC2_65_9]
MIRAWAYALALIVLGFPVFSPDLFWHLSAGRWIMAHARVPRFDPFSFTAAGAPWIDFEWATQLLFYGVNVAGGETGLWVLKIVLLLAAFVPVDGLLRDRDASPLARAGALAIWTAAMVPQGDLRADLVSTAFFAWLLRRLESGRASFLFGFGLFAFWSNLHAGFALGFFLYALYALASRFTGGRRPEGLAAEAAGAVLGSLLNPYGLGLYRVLLAHATEPAMARFVMEWGPPNWHRAFQIPLLAALAATAAAAFSARERLPRALAAAALVLGLATAASARFGAYFASAAAACVFAAFPRPRAEILAAGLAALSLMLAPPLLRVRWGASFQDDYVARRAVEFIVRERDVLGSLRLFNQYEWGGYLGWRMGESYKVFGDGRYLFHGQLPEIQKALVSAAGISALAERRGLGGFLIKNESLHLASTRVYPDGSRREILRPWYVFMFPREHWALVYWDDQALLFLDRSKVPAEWLAAHEYRWLRPSDAAALQDALSRGEVQLGALQAERVRHGAQTAR